MNYNRVRGRYGGGVRVADGYYLGRKYLKPDQQERGFADIGYHFYITRDGITHVCRPIDHIGAHARCFNDHSIGVCYEGGLDEQGQPADTRTMEQKIALIALLRQLRLDYPEARIAGHNELSTNVHKACPCFKASREYKDL